MSYTRVPPVLIRHSIDNSSHGLHPRALVFNTAGAWPSANLAIYIPVVVPVPVVVRSLWFGCGSTGTGNVDMAVYDANGTALIAATAGAKTAATTEQVFNTTDTFLAAGIYYIGLSSDSATDTFHRNIPTAPLAAAYGCLTESSAYPLPSTATWVVNNTLAYLPLVGMFIEAIPA